MLTLSPSIPIFLGLPSSFRALFPGPFLRAPSIALSRLGWGPSASLLSVCARGRCLCAGTSADARYGVSLAGRWKASAPASSSGWEACGQGRTDSAATVTSLPTGTLPSGAKNSFSGSFTHLKETRVRTQARRTFGRLRGPFERQERYFVPEDQRARPFGSKQARRALRARGEASPKPQAIHSDADVAGR